MNEILGGILNFDYRPSVRLLRVAFFILFCLVGCDDGHLRGKVESSTDGKTYFAVIDDNGGQCGPIYLDGIIWSNPIGVYTEIEPGRHTIRCGTEISFEVPSGVRFAFDYWGP